MTAYAQLGLIGRTTHEDIMRSRLTRAEKGAEVLVHHAKGKRSSEDFRRDNQGQLRPAIGTAQCICGQCGHGFNSVGAFDMHQTMSDGDLICWEPSSLGMARNARGWWVTALREDIPA